MNRRNKAEYTTFLYARPSFFEGIARIIDFSGVLQEYNASSTPEHADERAVRADWIAVGTDMLRAMTSIDLERQA